MVHTELVLVFCLWGALAVNGNSTGALAWNGNSTDIRLVGPGSSPCSGRVEVFHSGQWGTVCDDSFGLTEATVVCRQLDCGSALQVKREAHFGRGSGPVWLDEVTCRGNENFLTQCKHTGIGQSNCGHHEDVSVICSDSVRLVSGRSLCSGSLQIRDQSLNQSLSRSWRWVCEGALDHVGAEVLCRELGCGPPLLQGELSPLEQTFHCEGHESALMDCPRNRTRTNPQTCSTLQLICSEPVRLVGGASCCDGNLEAEFRGEWRRVTSYFWDLESAAVVCQSLDCGSAVPTVNRRVSDRTIVWWVDSDCVKKSSVRDCLHSSNHGNDFDFGLQVVCSDSVRLVSGQSLCSGSLQVRDQSLNQSLSRSWTWVCEGALDRVGAEVLCRELDCGPPVLQGELSPLGQMFHCEGHESALMDCPRNQTRTNPQTCSTLQLTCSEPVRLVGGASHCEGTLEAEFRGEWRRVTNAKNWWDLKNAADFCQSLDCGSAVSTEMREGLDRAKVWRVDYGCVKKSSVRYCLYDDSSDLDDKALQVVCSDSVRLVSGWSLCSGSLQVRDESLNQSLSRSWTSVCEGALDRVGAEVLCRELGCGPPLLQGELSPLRQTFHCEGHESALMNCPRDQNKTNPQTCSTLQLTCSEPVRLVGGASRCEGTLEAGLRGEWRRVMTHYLWWELANAAYVCQSLNCGSAVSTELRKGLDMTKVWTFIPGCVKKSSVRNCIFVDSSKLDDKAVQVVCSDSVRLVSGRSLCSGSLQIQNQSLFRSWTWVCEGALDRVGAEVLCKELRCGPPLLQGELSPLEQTFHCEGHESALMDCPRNQTRTDPQTCSTLQLTCSEPLRLVGGASRCDGTLEAELRGEWKRVATDHWWNLEFAADVCQSLNCGSAVSIVRRKGPDQTYPWWVISDCMKESSVRDCIFDGYLRLDSGLQVVCSDLLHIPKVSVSEGAWPVSQGAWPVVQVLMGARLQVQCSVEPQFPGGFFHLFSPTVNLTLPAVNHSAHFLFTDVSPAHRGTYTCVYLLHMFNHSFTSNSSIYIDPQGESPKTLIPVLVSVGVVLIVIATVLTVYCKRRAEQRAGAAHAQGEDISPQLLLLSME